MTQRRSTGYGPRFAQKLKKERKKRRRQKKNNEKMATTETETEEVTHLPKLKDADSFPLWDFEIKILMCAKELINIVDGSDLLSDQGRDKDNIRKWKMQDAKCQYYIVRMIEKHVKTHIVTRTTAKEMYDILKQIYQRDISQQKCLLLQDFYNFKYDKTKDMMTNISHVQNIAFKLCQLNQNVDENMIMTKITTILPEDYKHFSTAWDSTATVDRTLDNLVARLMLEEVKCKMTTKEEESIAFKTVTKSKSKTPFKCFNCNQIGHAQINCPNKGKRNCSICKRNNHSEKDCYFRNKDSVMRKQCTVCKKTNHAEKDCYFKDRNKRRKVNFLAEAAETHMSDAREKDKM
ncbi:hypothetical protein B7P43_G06357 [Cryptotermes secundus]|uniref:CCHC-type domain-containing protein n=1 Tax=Cryptotermes secundus TaxID=105785 RepID=A0A2J7QBS9_9NEOP|nr:hypothetical protein B7P43_G06357 [Cryptotermes secundus]